MKKLSFALSGLFLLLLVSCEKENLSPYSNAVEVNTIIDDYGSEKGGGLDSAATTDTTKVITDPNRDEDEDRKIKRKNPL